MINGKGKNTVERHMNLLSLEVAEIKEISEIIFRRIDNKIGVLGEIEASVDKKIASLEQLLRRAEHVEAPPRTSVKPPTNSVTRQQEIVAMRQRGLKIGEIAGTLHMPVGEVELVLGLHQRT
jgi:hypothetical protein